MKKILLLGYDENGKAITHIYRNKVNRAKVIEEEKNKIVKITFKKKS